MVRLWQEAGADQPARWRGSVEHVRTGRTQYFTELADLGAFIQENLGTGRPHENRRAAE